MCHYFLIYSINAILVAKAGEAAPTASPLLSMYIVLEAGKVQNTVLVPAPKSTALSEFELLIIVSLDNVSGLASVTVPIPTSNAESLTIA